MKVYLVLAVIITGLLIVVLSEIPIFRRITSEMIFVVVFWSPLLFQLIGLRATSSLCASVASMLSIGGALYLIIAPDSNRLFALLLILIAALYYLGSMRTWQEHERFWRSEKARIDEQR